MHIDPKCMKGILTYQTTNSKNNIRHRYEKKCHFIVVEVILPHWNEHNISNKSFDFEYLRKYDLHH